MDAKLKVLYRVIVRRMAAGETFEDIIKQYPGVEVAQIEVLKKELDIDAN